MKSNSSIFLSALLSLVVPSQGHAQLHLWTATETRHVLRSESPSINTSVQLGAARNEWVSFQILLRSDEGVHAINLEAGALQGPNGSVLHIKDARLYRQHQLHLETGTHRNDKFKPDWYPDPLIPFL